MKFGSFLDPNLIVTTRILHVLFVASSDTFSHELSRQQQQKVVDNLENVMRSHRFRLHCILYTSTTFFTILFLIRPTFDITNFTEIKVSTIAQINEKHGM